MSDEARRLRLSLSGGDATFTRGIPSYQGPLDPATREERMSSLRAFIAGFLTLAVVQTSINCGKSDTGTNPDPDPTVEVERIHEGALAVEDAFRTGDPAAVRAVMTGEAVAAYGPDLESLAAQMPGFAEAIGTRELVVYTECYAEYRYAAGTRTLSFALAAQEDGVWKLVRF
jgi:hypothetical protein